MTQVVGTAVDALDPLLPEHIPDPFPIWRKLQAADPVHWSEPSGLWFVSRHADFLDVLSRDGKDVTSVGIGREGARGSHPAKRTRWQPVLPAGAASGYTAAQEFGSWRENLQVMDPPDHTRLRRLISKGFSAKTVRLLGLQIQDLVDDLLDRVPSDAGGMDFPVQFSNWLPVLTVATILGVGPEHHEFFVEVRRLREMNFDAFPAPEVLAQWAENRPRFEAIVERAVKQRRANPGDDVVSHLIAAEVDGDRLTDAEVLSTCLILMDAGAVSTAALIANAMHLMLEDPKRTAELRRNPDLMTTAIDEFLRYAPSGHYSRRVAVNDFELGGKQIGAGEAIVLMKGIANRDPAVFDNPDEVHLDRNPNPHLTLGRGIHYCVGAPLAKLEAATALRTILERYPRLRLDGPGERFPSYASRTFKHLPIAFS